jgi:lysophospholipase L1-like esterase
MRTAKLTIYVALLVSFMGMSCFGQRSGSSNNMQYPAPQRIENEIQSFEAADRKHPAPQAAIVCVGSSSMRGWHERIENDLAPLTIVPRGFGGSNMNDLLHYANKIVLPYRPRAIVIYEGDNDIAQGIAPEKVAGTFRAVVKKVHAELPECRIYFLSIKPSISRWSLWPRMKKANSLIAAESSKDKRLTFVDVASGMLDDEGNPRKELFKEDNLHMTRGGYVIWRDALRPILVKTELQYEPQKEVGAGKRSDETSNKTDAGECK